MPASVVALAAASTFAPALEFLAVVAYFDDGTTLCGLLYTRLFASNWES